MGALAIGALARGNDELQARIFREGATPALIYMISDFENAEAQKDACGALAILSQDANNQVAIAREGSIPPLVELIKSNRTEIHENAAWALSLLGLHAENNTQITDTGGIKPLVALLTSGNDRTQRHAAVALEGLARDNVDNQVAIAGFKAPTPLVSMLASETEETAQSAVAMLLCLAEHPSSQKTVIKKLVDVLLGRNTTSQLKATEALAVLSSRSSNHRNAIVKAGAIQPLVVLLGNGQRAESGTPPERAAAVLADLSRLAESKVEIARCGGIQPLVTLLSSSSQRSQTHSAVALFHLSAAADNKATMTNLQVIPLLVKVLSIGTVEAQRHAAGALWQLATSVDNKNGIVLAGGIEALISILKAEDWEEEGSSNAHTAVSTEMINTARSSPNTGRTVASTGTARKDRTSAISLTPLMQAKETAAALLAELARSQNSFKVAIVKAGGMAPLVDLMMSEAPGAQKQATCAVWGLACEPRYRRAIGSIEGTVERLVELLSEGESETQGFSASALVCIASDDAGRAQIKAANAAGHLMSVAMGPESWLRSQCVQVLKLLGYPDPQNLERPGASTTSSPLALTLPKDTKEVDDMMALLGYTDEQGNPRPFAGSSQQQVIMRYQHNPKPMLIEYVNPYANYLPTSPRNQNSPRLSPREYGAPAACGPGGSRLSSHAGTSSALLARFQAMLASNPDLWMMHENKPGGVPDDFMAAEAAAFRVNDRVTVLMTEKFVKERKAIVAYVGKVPEIAPGFWVGVKYKDKEGKNDGSINNVKYFDCPAEHGGFVRPSRLEPDTTADPDAPGAKDLAGAPAAAAATGVGTNAPPKTRADPKLKISKEKASAVRDQAGTASQRSQRSQRAGVGAQKASRETFMALGTTREEDGAVASAPAAAVTSVPPSKGKKSKQSKSQR